MSDTDADRDHGHGYEHQDPADWIPGAVLDGEIFMPPVFRALTTEIELNPLRILDIGCGPGVGTVALAENFADAQVVGLDVGEAVLAAGRDRVETEGLASRVSFVRADFDQDLTAVVAPADLVFASMSLHHTEDPSRAVGRVCATLMPGGRLVVAEFGRPLTMFPDDHGVMTSGLWSRWQAASEAHRLDHLGPASVNINWPALLEAQGLEHVRSFEVDVKASAPLGDLERTWLAKVLERGLQHLGDRLDQPDRAAVQSLLADDNPHGVARSADALIDAGRMIYTGVVQG